MFVYCLPHCCYPPMSHSTTRSGAPHDALHLHQFISISIVSHLETSISRIFMVCLTCHEVGSSANGCRLVVKSTGSSSQAHWPFFSLFSICLIPPRQAFNLAPWSIAPNLRHTVPMNIGNDAVNVWIANFSASCRACLYSSAAEHWSRKPGVRSSILLGGCLRFFFLPFYIFFFALSFLQSLPQLKKKNSLKRHGFANVDDLFRTFVLKEAAKDLM